MRIHVAAAFAALLALAAPGAAQEALPLTLAGALEQALTRNAQLAVRAAEVAAAEAGAKGAGKPPPIQLSFSPASIIQQLEVSVSAVLGISRQRKWASRAARHELTATVAGNEEFRLELIAATESAYWRLRLAQERLEVARQTTATAEEVRRATERLVQEGLGKRIDLDRAQGELEQARLEEQEATAAIRQAQIELATLIGAAPETLLLATDALPAPVVLPSVDLQQTALAGRPAIKRMEALASAALAWTQVAGAERDPSLGVSLAGEDEVSFGRALIDLPLIDLGTIKYGKRAARARARAAAAEIEVTRVEVREEVVAAAETLEYAQDEARRLQDDLIPRQEGIVSRLQRGFEQRAVSYLEALEAQTELQALRRQWLEATGERLEAGVRLERAIGARLEEINDG